MPMRRISERLVRQRLVDAEILDETVVVDGNWYWKSKGTCWTQPTDKSEPRKEISEEEYRDICSKAKNGVTELPKKKENISPILPKEVQSRMMSLKDTSEYLEDDSNLFKDIEKTYRDCAKKLGVEVEDLVSDNLEYSDNADTLRDLIDKSELVSSNHVVGSRRSTNKVYKSPEGINFVVHRDDRYEDTIFISKSAPKKSDPTPAPKPKETTTEKKPAPPKKKVTPTPAPTKSTKPKTSFLDVWRESSDAVVDLANDYETVATVSGKSIIVDLGDKDLNNKKLMKKLEKSGYVQYSRFRWRYDHN